MHLHIDVFILNVGMRTRGVGARAQGSCSPQRFDILPQRRSGLAGCLVSNGASARTRHRVRDPKSSLEGSNEDS